MHLLLPVSSPKVVAPMSNTLANVGTYSDLIYVLIPLDLEAMQQNI